MERVPNSPETRTPGQGFLKKARRIVQIVTPAELASLGIAQTDKRQVVRTLTDPSDLNLIFPKVVEGTLYQFFSTSFKTTKALLPERIYFVHDQPHLVPDRVYREAALGMQDNLAFH